MANTTVTTKAMKDSDRYTKYQYLADICKHLFDLIIFDYLASQRDISNDKFILYLLTEDRNESLFGMYKSVFNSLRQLT